MDITSFLDYLDKTPDIFEAHRGRITPSKNYSYSDEPRPQADVLKPPLSLSAMEYADLEAGAFGNIILHSMHMGTLPRIKTSHLLQTRRRDHEPHTRLGIPLIFDSPECVGTRSYVEGSSLVVEMMKLSEHAKSHAAPILTTEGIDPFLSYADKIRTVSEKLISRPADAKDWMTIEEAANFSGLSPATIEKWLTNDKQHEINVSCYPGCEPLINKKSFRMATFKRLSMV